MKREYKRLSALLVLGVTIGYLFEIMGLALAGALAVYVFLQNLELKKLIAWQNGRLKDVEPALHGSLYELKQEIAALKERHQSREDKLLERLKRFQEATKALPDAVIILDHAGCIEWANSRAQELLGIRWPDDARRKIINLVRNQKLNEALESNIDVAGKESLTIASPENPDMKLEIRLSSYSENLKLLIAQNVTHLHQINQIRKDFIANASHELRTPLTVIAGYLEAIEGDTDTPVGDLTPQIAEMRKQTRRMQTLIGDLLTLSELEAADHLQSMQILNISELLTAIYNEVSAMSKEQNHIFSLEADHKLMLMGNSVELHSAFSNLAVNAVRYTPEKGVIVIRWYKNNDTGVMEVSDNGEGIAPEHVNRITERFYRVDKGRSRSEGGTGLGLAIVKHVLMRHGAKLEIASELGRGSTFRCIFPEKLLRVNNEGHEPSIAQSQSMI